MTDGVANNYSLSDPAFPASVTSAANRRPATPIGDSAGDSAGGAAASGVLVVVNSKAGSGRGRRTADAAISAIRGRGFSVHEVQDLRNLKQLAAELAAAGDLRAAVAVGGDGTVGAILNETPPGTPIGVVPAGTENLLAKYTGLRVTGGEIAGLLERGVVVQMDAGCAGDRLFALMISAGFDAEVVRKVHAHRDGNITHLAYAKPILDAVCTYPYPAMRVSWTDRDGAEQQTTGRWVFGVNLPRYAQGLPIVPEASGVDRLLDVCVFRRGGTAAGLWYLWNILRRRRQKVESVTTARCGRFRIESDEPNVAYQLDGDPGGVLPVEVSVAPCRLSLLVSRSAAERLGFDTAAV
ncbi:MAG: diacylglycerol kinase family protein [Planctomycetota bacterium]